MRYLREYMPENQIVTKCVLTPPEPRKGVHEDALGRLGEATNCLKLLVIAYFRLSSSGASQNKIDDDGEYQNKMKKTRKAKNINKRL